MLMFTNLPLDDVFLYLCLYFTCMLRMFVEYAVVMLLGRLWATCNADIHLFAISISSQPLLMCFSMYSSVFMLSVY